MCSVISSPRGHFSLGGTNRHADIGKERQTERKREIERSREGKIDKERKNERERDLDSEMDIDRVRKRLGEIDTKRAKRWRPQCGERERER